MGDLSKLDPRALDRADLQRLGGALVGLTAESLNESKTELAGELCGALALPPRELGAWAEQHRAAVLLAVRQLAENPDPAAIRPLARLVALAAAGGVTSTHKALARLLGQLAADQIADLRRAARLAAAGARRNERTTAIQAHRDHRGPYLIVNGNTDRLQTEGDELLQAMQTAGLSMDAKLFSRGEDAASAAIRPDVVALLVEVLGPEPEGGADAAR